MFSPIQLLSHNFIQIHLAPNFADEHEEQDGCHYITAHHVEKENLWLVKLLVELNSEDDAKPSPYEGALEIVGKFEVNENFPKEKTTELVYQNGGAILYGAIREMVVLLTEKTLNETLYLPTINASSFIPTEEELDTAEE